MLPPHVLLWVAGPSGGCFGLLMHIGRHIDMLLAHMEKTTGGRGGQGQETPYEYNKPCIEVQVGIEILPYKSAQQSTIHLSKHRALL